MKRNPSIELLRCVLMFGICLVHSAGKSGTDYQWLSYSLLWCVDCFVFISGYYGVRFSFAKVLRLYGLGLFCSLIGAALSVFLDHERELLVLWRREFCGYWFLHAYVLMMCLAPMADAAVESLIRDKKRLGVALLGLGLSVFGWGWLSVYNVTKTFIPRTPGLSDYSGFTLLAIYIVARLCNKLNLGMRISRLTALSVLLIITGLGVMRICVYNSPFAVLAAVAAFYLAEKTSVPQWLGRTVIFLAPSMFTVYLLQVNTAIFRDRIFEAYSRVVSIGVPWIVAIPCVAVLLFVSGTLIDLVRRGGLVVLCGMLSGVRRRQ